MPVTLIGRPSVPYPDETIAAVTRAVASVEGIAEAHFPQMYTASQMEKPEQTLVIVVGRDRAEQIVMQEVNTALRRELPNGPDILFILMTGRDGLLTTVRGTNCQLYKSATEKPAKKPWWRPWSSIF